MVDKAAMMGGDRINWFTTHYWLSNSDGLLIGYLYKDINGDLVPFNDQAITSFRSGMAHCFQHAVRKGLSISIVPHLDDGSSTDLIETKWRNGIVFDPLQKLNGYSYADIMLDPLAVALRFSINARTKVWMALQGEMSATVLYYPRAYELLARELHGTITTGIPGTPASVAYDDRVKTGVSFNFNKLDAPDAATPDQDQNGAFGIGSFVFRLLYGVGNKNARRRRGRRHGVPGPDLPRGCGVPAARRCACARAPSLSKDSIVNLLNTVGFVGISAYHSLPVDITANDMQASALGFFQEFSAFGIDVQSIVIKRGIELHYSEFGLGGGSSFANKVPAANVQAAANNPWEGVSGAYNAAADPFLTNPRLAAYQRQFYQATLAWLMQGSGPQVRIHACFMWNVDSWDVLGIYPESSAYRNEGIARQIAAHNLAVVSRNQVKH
ncbi:MAG: hypothetical protein WDW36_006780 [Sanguina aurantia]